MSAVLAAPIKRLVLVVFMSGLLGPSFGCSKHRGASSSLDSAGYSQDDAGFFINPASSAAKAVYASFAGADELRALAAHSVAVWYGSGDGNIGQAVGQQAAAAKAAQATAVMVVYNIPGRDCGNYSAGGLSADSYRIWIANFAAALQDASALIILEPDALPLMDCLDDGKKNERYDLLRYAVNQLKRDPHARVYLDGGNAKWKSVEETAQRLRQAGVDQADGFSLNVSNYVDDDTSIAFGQNVRASIGKNFVIDTSRNGNGANGAEWCNPRGRATGKTSTYATGVDGVDAFVWAKNPGESDGACNGGPQAGAFWPEVAIELARNGHLSAAPGTRATPPPAQPAPAGTPTPAQAPAPATPPTSPAQTSSAGLTAELVPIVLWQSGYCMSIVIKNNGATALASWAVTIDLHGGTITQSWNASLTPSGAQAVIKPNYPWGTTLPPGVGVNSTGFCADTPMDGAKATLGSVQ